MELKNVIVMHYLLYVWLLVSLLLLLCLSSQFDIYITLAKMLLYICEFNYVIVVDKVIIGNIAEIKILMCECDLSNFYYTKWRMGSMCYICKAK